MTTYRQIHGRSVKAVATDPTAEVTEGEIWYNTTSDTFKSIVASGAWSSGSSMISARYRAGGAGTQTAGLAFGGSTGNPGAQPSTNATEEYNGSGWSTGGNLNEARRGLGGAGTQIAGLAFAGSPSPSDSNTTNLTEEYNGSSWTAVNTMNTARQTFMGAGTQTAAFAAGGVVPPGYTNTNASEVYDGTNWTASPGTIGTASRQGAASGTSTAGLIFGGGTSPSALITTTQTFDGSTYTTVNSMNTARRGLAGSGTQTAAIAFGGSTPSPGYEVLTESWDGTSWAVSPVLATGRQFIAGAVQAPSSASLAFSGFVPGATSALTEEYNFTANTITPGAWASAPSIGTGRYLGGYGITPTNASIIFGGQSATGSVANTEEYNGSSWAENPDMNTARSRINGFGTQTAAVTMGGRQVGVPPNSSMNNTELYDGSSWTNGPTYPLTARGIGGAGTNAAGLAIAAWTGSPPGFTTCNDWNGSGWTAAEANLNTARGYVSGWGTQSDAGAAGGPPANTDYEEYNGSSWTTKASLVSATGAPSGGAAGFGGTPGAIKANGNGGTFSQEWNGTSWGTAVSRANTNYGGGMSGGNTAASGIVTGGYIYPSTGPATGSEEFTGETITVNPASNIDVS